MLGSVFIFLLTLLETQSTIRVSPIVNQTYGYPDGIGGLIIEVPFNYPNGPSAWTPNNTWGAYGIIIAPGSLNSSGCQPIPSNSPFKNTSMQPVALKKDKACMIGCNMTDIINGATDPCNIGSIKEPSNSPMSCWDIGSMARGYGVCAYNCTALVSNSNGQLIPCSQNNLDNGTCAIYCDTRTFPN